MAQITLITVGTLKEDYLKEAVTEYAKRIGQFARLEEKNIKEEAIYNEDDKSEIARALSTEGKKILSLIPEGAYRIALCVEGKQYSSEELAKIIGSACDASGKIAIIIGSSHGLSDEVKARCDLKLSISRLTFPHQLIRPVILETVYRSFTILHGKRYHK